MVSEQSIHRDRAPSVPPHRLRFLAIFPISGDSVPLPQRFPTLPSGELDPSGVLPPSHPNRSPFSLRPPRTAAIGRAPLPAAAARCGSALFPPPCRSFPARPTAPVHHQPPHPPLHQSPHPPHHRPIRRPHSPRLRRHPDPRAADAAIRAAPRSRRPPRRTPAAELLSPSTRPSHRRSRRCAGYAKPSSTPRSPPPPPPRSSGRRRRHPSRSPFPTTSPPHAGSRAPQPVHAPEPPSQSPLRGLRQALFDPQVAASRGRRRAMLLTPEFLPAATLVADALSCIRAIHAYSKPIISVQIW